MTWRISPWMTWPTFSSSVIFFSSEATFSSSASSLAKGHFGDGQISGWTAAGSSAFATAGGRCLGRIFASEHRQERHEQQSRALFGTDMGHGRGHRKTPVFERGQPMLSRRKFEGEARFIDRFGCADSLAAASGRLGGFGVNGTGSKNQAYCHRRRWSRRLDRRKIMLGQSSAVNVQYARDRRPEPVFPGQAEATLPRHPRLAAIPRRRTERLHRQDAIHVQPGLPDSSTGQRPGQNFSHPLRRPGCAGRERRPFYHFWHKAKALGLKPKIELFSQELALGVANRFIFPTNSLGVAPHLRYALHVDLALMTAPTCDRSPSVPAWIRVARKVVSVTRREEGFIDELQFEDGVENCRADLFVDCSGSAASSSARSSSPRTRTGSSGCPAIASCTRRLPWKIRGRPTRASARGRPDGNGAFRCNRT